MRAVGETSPGQRSRLSFRNYDNYFPKQDRLHGDTDCTTTLFETLIFLYNDVGQDFFDDKKPPKPRTMH